MPATERHARSRRLVLGLGLVVAVLGWLVSTASASHAVRLTIEPSATCILQGGGIDFIVRAVDASGQVATDVNANNVNTVTPAGGVSGPGIEHTAPLAAGVHTYDPGHSAANFGVDPFALVFANTGTYTLTATSGTLTGSVQIQVVTNLAQCQATPTTTTTTTRPPTTTTTTTAPTTTTTAPTTTTTRPPTTTTTTAPTTTTTAPTTTTTRPPTTTTTGPTTTTTRPPTTTTTGPTTTTTRPPTTTTTGPTTTTTRPPTTTTRPTTTTTGVVAACKPGYGFGDRKHCHTGPPGQLKKDGDNNNPGGPPGGQRASSTSDSSGELPMLLLGAAAVLLLGSNLPWTRRRRGVAQP